MPSCAVHRLRVAFEAQSELGFMVWAYATNDPLPSVLAPSYFLAVQRQVRIGDLIYVGVSPLPDASPWQDQVGETRRCLLMVAGNDRAGVRTRLVQDFGRPDDPSAPLADPPRPRGRPKKPPTTPPSPP